MTLTELVLSEIRAHAEALELDEAAMLVRLQAQRTAADAERQESVRQEIGKLRRRVYELEQMTAKLYEDKVCGSISAASFAVLLEKTEQERRQRTDRLDTLLAEIREYEQSAADIQSWAAVVRKHLHIRELDRETVDELIDRIEVGEKTVVDGKNVRDIKIYYRFVGNILLLPGAGQRPAKLPPSVRLCRTDALLAVVRADDESLIPPQAAGLTLRRSSSSHRNRFAGFRREPCWGR